MVFQRKTKKIQKSTFNNQVVTFKHNSMDKNINYHKRKINCSIFQPMVVKFNKQIYSINNQAGIAQLRNVKFKT